MLAGIIFDFDGVIVDSHPVHLQAWKDFFLSMNKEVPDDELSFVLEGAKKEEILRHFLGDLTEQQARLYGAEKEKLFRSHAAELKMVRGFDQFLAQVEAAGLPIAVATSGSRTRVEDTMEHFDLHGRFRAVVTGDDVPRGKPDPGLFYLAARGMQVDAENILVCEDAVAGVAAARAAGMKCLAIAANGREKKLKDAGANLVMEDFTKAELDGVRSLFVHV
jgi:beta-phosphoglucomutase